MRSVQRYLSIWMLAALVVCTGCADQRRDIREVMMHSAEKRDSYFPDGQHRRLTQFAYIGTVDSRRGMLRVAACRSIIPDMLSPRGQSWLSIHDSKGEWIGSTSYQIAAPPLWCEGSKVYFFGLQGSEEDGGNALDFASGFEKRRFVFAPAKGSWMPSPGDVEP